MANELDVTRKVSNIKTKKLKSIIDFSALVSLSFLLIMFFMLTSAIKRPQSMELTLPEGCHDCDYLRGCSSGIDGRIVTILLDSDNKIIYYHGMLHFPILPPTIVNYGQNGIRKALLNQKNLIKKFSEERGRYNDNISVIIKPSKQSNYKNLVDILDEMEIIGVKGYSIVNDFTPKEMELLSDKY